MTENEAKLEYCRAIDIIKRIKTEETHERYVDRHKAFDMAIQALEEIQQYRAIGTIDEFKSLKEKEIPKKPIIKPWSAARCPTCDCSLSESLGDGYYQHFESLERCDKCNQKLDWQ